MKFIAPHVEWQHNQSTAALRVSAYSTGIITIHYVLYVRQILVHCLQQCLARGGPVPAHTTKLNTSLRYQCSTTLSESSEIT